MHTRPKPPDPIERWEGEGGAAGSLTPFRWRDFLEFVPDHSDGPYVKGTGILAMNVANRVYAGWDFHKIIREYLWDVGTREILACLMWAEEGRPTS